jgi:hypothetical protein
MSKRPDATQKLNAVRGMLGTMSFVEISRLSTNHEKREKLLSRCDEVYELAQTRTRPMRDGEMVDPDAHSMLKAIELAMRIMGLGNEPDQGEEEKRETDIQRIISLLDSVGYEVKKRAA